jgi:hypothetical protein
MRGNKLDIALTLPTGVAGCQRHVGELAVETAGKGGGRGDHKWQSGWRWAAMAGRACGAHWMGLLL